MVPQLVAPIVERGVELVLGAEGKGRLDERVVTKLIDTLYRHRWSSVGPVRVLRFPALIALGMSDRGDGWDVDIAAGSVIDGEAEETSQFAAAKADEAGCKVVDPQLIDVSIDGGKPRPIAIREAIRAFGPTI